MEIQGIWLIVAAGVVLLLGGVAALFFVAQHRARAAGLVDDEGRKIKLPMAPLQKRAVVSLVIGLLLTLSMVAVYVVKGAVAVSEETGMRLFVTGLFLLALLSYAWLLFGARGKDGSSLDERDRHILASAPNAQVVVVLVALAAWNIALTELYRADGAVPVEYLNLIFFSVFVLNMLAGAVGILLGYWRRASQ